MKNYLECLGRILSSGDVKEPARENMPRTKELFGEMLKFDLQEGFPLVTTKKLFVKGVVEEVLWFLRGSTNVGDLIKEGVNIWNEDGYKFYKRKAIENGVNPKMIYDEVTWTRMAKGELEGSPDMFDLGQVYGYLWRTWDKGKKTPAGIDQILKLINMILRNPASRYQLVTAWDPTVVESNNVALPSCHVLWQTNVRSGKYLDLAIYQRSCDYILGVPFNIASYAYLVHILAKLTGYEPGVLTWIGGSVHVYENQAQAAEEQLSRVPGLLPDLHIKISDDMQVLLDGCKDRKRWTKSELNLFLSLMSRDMFTLENYDPQPAIKAPLSTGLKLEPYELVFG